MNIRIERTEDPTPNKEWYRAYDADTLDYDSLQGFGSDEESALVDLENRMAERRQS